ncbi:isochorismatase family protein [Nocardiopsis oceani]
MPIWDKFLTENDRTVFDTAGYGTYLGPGKHPALLVVDVSYAFTGDKGESLIDSITGSRNSCGPRAWQAIPHIQSLLEAARAKNVPTFYTTGYDTRPGDVGTGLWRSSRKDEVVRPAGRNPQEIVAEVAPQEQDIVLTKRAPSAFHGTPLASDLTGLGVDTLIVVGTTTSGCVRATVVDAFSNNLRVLVAEEGCFDRGEASHAMALFDLNAKYADVMASPDVLEYFAGLESDLYGPMR